MWTLYTKRSSSASDPPPTVEMKRQSLGIPFGKRQKRETAHTKRSSLASDPPPTVEMKRQWLGVSFGKRQKRERGGSDGGAKSVGLLQACYVKVGVQPPSMPVGWVAPTPPGNPFRRAHGKSETTFVLQNSKLLYESGLRFGVRGLFRYVLKCDANAIVAQDGQPTVSESGEMMKRYTLLIRNPLQQTLDIGSLLQEKLRILGYRKRTSVNSRPNLKVRLQFP